MFDDFCVEHVWLTIKNTNFLNKIIDYYVAKTHHRKQTNVQNVLIWCKSFTVYQYCSFYYWKMIYINNELIRL